MMGEAYVYTHTHTHTHTYIHKLGVRVLSLDGGGIRGLVLVEQLRKIEQETGKMCMTRECVCVYAYICIYVLVGQLREIEKLVMVLPLP